MFLLLSLVWGTVNLNARRRIVRFFAHNSPKFGKAILDDDALDFGQWVPVLLLLMPVMSIVDTYSRQSSIYSVAIRLTHAHRHNRPRSASAITDPVARSWPKIGSENYIPGPLETRQSPPNRTALPNQRNPRPQSRIRSRRCPFLQMYQLQSPLLATNHLALPFTSLRRSQAHV